MSDTPQGEGWWEASDGRWYPPESVPGPGPSAPGGFQAPAPSPFEPPSEQSAGPPPGGVPGGQPPGYGAPPGPAPGYGAPSAGVPPAGPPPGFGPPGGQPPGYGAPAYGAPGAAGYGGVSAATKKSSRTIWIVLAIIAGLLILGCGGCVAFVGFSANEAAQGEGFEFITELGIDFSAGVPATGPVSCEVTGDQNDGDYAVDALVTNASGVTSHYRVDYDLFGPNQDYLGSDFGIVSDLGDGESVRDFTVGTIDGPTDWRDVTCEVTQTLRIEAG